MTDSEKENPTSWWHTLPGVITALTGLVTAITALIVGLNQTGVIGIGDKEQIIHTNNENEVEVISGDDRSKAKTFTEWWQ